MPEKEFREKNNVRMCEKCCATCAYGIDLCDDGRLDVFDLVLMRRELIER